MSQKRQSREELKARILGVVTSPEEVHAEPAPTPRIPQDLRIEPDAEIPEPLRQSILEDPPRRRAGKRSSNDHIQKGWLIEKKLIPILDDFSRDLGWDTSELVNRILKAALAEDTAPDEFRPYLDKIRRRQLM